MRDKNTLPFCIMLGPAENAFGGMASVVAVYRAGGLFDSGQVCFIATVKQETKFGKLVSACSALVKYFIILLRGGGQVLHVHVAAGTSFWRKFFFIWLARIFGRSILFHLHSGDFRRYCEERCSPLLRFILLRTLSSVNHVACLSSPTATWLKQKIPGVSVSLLSNPVEVDHGPRGRKACPPTVLYLGAINRDKGVFDLVHAFARILKDEPTARLVLGGSGDLRGVRALAVELGCSGAIATPGWVGSEKKFSLLSEARMLALPSYFEGQPMALLEAMAAGVLVVASRVGGIPDIVRDQHTGILTEPGDINGLTTALVAGMALSAKNDTLVAEAYRYVCLVHSVSKVKQDLLALYARLTPQREKAVMGSGQSILQQWLGRIRFWLIDLARGTNSVELLRDLESIQFESPEAIKFRQEALLKTYVNLVRRSSPLYETYQCITQFPVIDKKFANENWDLLLNRSYKGRIFRKKTGGSTGQPFVYITGTVSQSYLWAAILLSWKVAGYRLGEPVAFLAGSSLFSSGYKQFLYYKLMNVRLFSAFDMSANSLNSYGDAIARGGFRLLYGYASAIHQLAMHLLAAPARPGFSLRGVVCTAETLTPAMRETIEAAFGVPCFSQYGCHDAGISAYECEHRDGFHLVTTCCYPEVLEGGRFISTDISNDAFFLPRYDTGDLVTMADGLCSCGRGFPLIKEVIGRANDMVSDQAGNMVHSEFFTHMFREDRRILAFQVLYDARKLVVNLHCREVGGEWSNYQERTRATLAFDHVSFMENIPFVTLANGKHRFVMQVDDVDAALADFGAGKRSKEA
ncbi:MAG: glycosyltransferase [Nitrosospira sp.]